MLIVVFGLSGAGKNFVGQILETHFNFHFWDADKALPQEMQEAIQKKQPFKQEMRDNFTQEIIQTINRLQDEKRDIAVTQALYKNRNRLQLLKAFPNAKFIYVSADDKQIYERLSKREVGIDADYANKIRLNFEIPTHQYIYLENNSSEEDVVLKLKEAISSLNEEVKINTSDKNFSNLIFKK